MKVLQERCMSGEPICGIINRRLLPVKIHMFLYVGSLAGVMPFIVIHAKQLGISAGLAGTGNAVMLITSVVLKFYLGALADKYKAIKGILCQVVLLQAIFHMAIYLCIPKIESTDTWKPRHENENLLRQDLEYRFSCICNNTEDYACQMVLNETSHLVDGDGCTLPVDKTGCLCNQEFRESPPYALYTWQFWVFLLLRIGSGGLASVGFSLTDAATYSVLGDGNKELYGRQRLWGTMSWGGMAPLIGVLNEMFSTSTVKSYGPGFYIHFAMSMLDIVAVCFLDVPNPPRSSKNIISDILKLFSSPHVLFFTLSVFVQGTLMGPIWSYGFWYLQKLGAPQSLLGINLAVQCFIGEVPVMFFAGWIINKIGFKHSISLAVFGVVLRLLVYYLFSDPWLMLPIEITHGLSFGLFYTAMTLYANRVAPDGTEASVQGIMSGMFEGAGIAVGTLVCGFLFETVGERSSIGCFFFYGFAFFVVQLIVNYFLGDPPLAQSGAKKQKPMNIPEITLDEASQVEQLLREGTVSPSEVDASEVKNSADLEEEEDPPMAPDVIV